MAQSIYKRPSLEAYIKWVKTVGLIFQSHLQHLCYSNSAVTSSLYDIVIEIEQALKSDVVIAGNIDNFKNAFEGSNVRGLGEAFYSGLYSYAGW